MKSYIVDFKNKIFINDFIWEIVGFDLVMYKMKFVFMILDFKGNKFIYFLDKSENYDFSDLFY